MWFLSCDSKLVCSVFPVCVLEGSVVSAQHSEPWNRFQITLLCTSHLHCWGRCHLSPHLSSCKFYLLLACLRTECCKRLVQEYLGENQNCQVESSAFYSVRQLKCPHDLIIKILLVKYILNLQRYHNKLTGLNKGLFMTLLIVHRTKTSSWRYFQRMGQTKNSGKWGFNSNAWRSSWVSKLQLKFTTTLHLRFALHLILGFLYALGMLHCDLCAVSRWCWALS